MKGTYDKGGPSEDELVAIKKRLREGKLQEGDLRQLEELVTRVERSAAALRAAVVE